MSSLESHAAEAPVRGAQTVAPVQASALQLAAAVLGEGGYTPTRQLNESLSAPARGVDAAPAPQPVETQQNGTPQNGIPKNEPVRTVGSGRTTAPAPTKGWFGRLLDKLLGRS